MKVDIKFLFMVFFAVVAIGAAAGVVGAFTPLNGAGAIIMAGVLSALVAVGLVGRNKRQSARGSR